MDFDDRLRGHMEHQSAQLEIQPEGVDAIARRARTRHQRRAAVMVTAALVVVAGLGGWLYGSTGQNTVDQVATEGDGTATTTIAAASSSEEGASADNDQALSSAAAPSIDAPVAESESGRALEFSLIDNVDAPGGFNVWQNGQAGGLYYVLSTAPGATFESLGSEEEWFRNDTLYTWDGGDWSQSSFGDRFVSDIGAGQNGLLYTLSTGRREGTAGLELGTSADGGANWAWTPIDLSTQFGADSSTWPGYNVRSVGVGDDRLVVVNKAPGPDWQEGIALAQGAGLDIDLDTTPIYNLTTEGITYSLDPYPEPTPCQQEFSVYIDAAFRRFEEETLGEEPTEEDYFAFEQNYEEIEAEAIAHMATIQGCELFVDCQTAYSADNRRIGDAENAIVEAMGFDPDTDYWEGLTEAQFDELNAAMETLWSEQQTAFEESGCQEILWGPIGDFEEGEGEFVSWASLGVTPPAHWSGSAHGYLVSDDTVTNLGAVFGDGGFLVELTGDENGVTVRFDATAYDGASEPTGPTFIEWSSADGRTWTSQQIANDEWTFYPAGTVGDATLSINWEEPTRFGTEFPGASILRTIDGTTEKLVFDDLAAELDIDLIGYSLDSLKTGEYGAVAWAVNWDVPDERNTIVLYSPDGVAWGATLLEGIEVVDMIVGADGVMAFGQNPELVNTGTPQPVFFGD
ncbi:MAG: hypothetical protein ACR2P0_02745 [Acidimicrobiales bacterium]